jgi:histidyl-tRNA synthetase
MIDHLCEFCHKHFKEVLEYLDEIQLPYRLNPYLVRGLDYYTKTVFEIFHEQKDPEKDGQQKSFAVAGGGRYDALVKILGGKDTPACGAACGIERIIDLMKEKGIKPGKEIKYDVFLAQLGTLAKRKSLKLIEEFRKERILIAESLGRDSLKVQLSKANKLEVGYTLILGQQESLEDRIIIRDMKTGNQETVKLDKVVAEMVKKIRK